MERQQSNSEIQNSQIKDNKLNKKTRGIVSIILLVFIVIVVVNMFSKDENKNEVVKQEAPIVKPQVQEVKEQTLATEKVTETAQQVSETIRQPEIKIPKYEIAHEVSGKRYDGGKIYYMLIDPVKLSDASFKDDIKIIINNITKENGAKISVHIFDKKTALESSFNEASYQKIPTPKEKTEDEIHNVAIFSGELKTNIYLNTLSFFPATFTDNKTVGKYVETIEFNPSQY